jgi:hypothetical protein
MTNRAKALIEMFCVLDGVEEYEGNIISQTRKGLKNIFYFLVKKLYFLRKYKQINERI